MQDPGLALLESQRGHFQLESGQHTDQWFDLDSLFSRPAQIRPYVSELATRLGQRGIEAVCGPMTGGAALARMIADELGIACLVAERHELPAESGRVPVVYRLRGDDRTHARGKAVALVDDAISAGSAIRGTYAELQACGARTVAFGALIVFNHAADQFAASHNLTLDCVARMPLRLWPQDECPLCAAQVPLAAPLASG